MDKVDAQALAEKFKTPRYREIENLERHLDGTIYDGRKPFFIDDGTPLLERRPCCRYPIAKIAIRSHGDMVLGEGKWPRVIAKRSAEGTSDEQKKALEKLLADMVEQGELRSRMREGLECAMGGRSVAFVGYVRRGKIGVQIFSGKCCTIDRDIDGCVEKLTISYPYLEEFRDPVTNKWTWRVCLYKRVIDEKSDTVFEPLVVDNNSQIDAEPTKVDKKKSRDHGLGFCPVAWYAFMPQGGHEDAIDGRALHEEQLADLITLDIGLSQRARSAHYAGDPQIWEAGVEPDEMPAPTGRGVSPMILDAMGKPLGFSLAPTQSQPKRQKGAGVVWSSRNEKYQVGQVTMPGDALDGLDNHVADLARRIGLALAYVDLDPMKAGTGEKSSGRALEILLKPQVEFDGRIREDYGEHGICAVLVMLLRVVHVTNKKSPGGVYLDGIGALAGLLDSFERPIAASTEDAAEAEGDDDDDGSYASDDDKPGELMWMPLPLDLEWGPLFADTSADTIKDKVDAATSAMGKLISQRTATASVAHAFGVEDVDEELEQLEEERAQAALATAGDPNANADGSSGGAAGGQDGGAPNAGTPGQSPDAAGSNSPQASKTPAPGQGSGNVAGKQNATGAGVQAGAQPSAGKVVPIMPKARAAMGAPKDPGGEGSAKIGRQLDAAGKVSAAHEAAKSGVPTLDPKAHLRAANKMTPQVNSGVSETVFDLLKEDYDEDDIAWIRSAIVEGPRLVPLDQIDFTNRESWSASGEDISSYVEKISAGTMKPIVLVNEPNDEKLMIIDGHHRALAYEELGAPAMAYVVHVGAVNGPWDAMHSSQKNGNGDPVLTSKQKV